MGSYEFQSRHFEQMARLIERFGSLPAELLEHEYSYQSFGSWLSIFRFKGVPLRLSFDGRDREIVVQRSASRKPPYLWGEPIWRKVSVTDADILCEELVAAVEGMVDAG